MRKSLMVLGLMLIGAGCGSPAIGELGEDLTVADCQKYLGNGNPFGNCPALDPTKVTAADCKTLDGTTPWNPKWDPTLPICFGLQGDINKYNDPKYVKGAANPPPKNCNYLQLPDPKYNDCANYKYEICSLGNKLPGQSGGDPKGKGQIIPVTDPGPLGPLGPGATTPGATVKEDCLFMQYCSNFGDAKPGKCFVCKLKTKPVYSASSVGFNSIHSESDAVCMDGDAYVPGCGCEDPEQ